MDTAMRPRDSGREPAQRWAADVRQRACAACGADQASALVFSTLRPR